MMLISELLVNMIEHIKQNDEAFMKIGKQALVKALVSCIFFVDA